MQNKRISNALQITKYKILLNNPLLGHISFFLAQFLLFSHSLFGFTYFF